MGVGLGSKTLGSESLVTRSLSLNPNLGGPIYLVVNIA